MMEIILTICFILGALAGILSKPHAYCSSCGRPHHTCECDAIYY